ncbi:hypothetical protein DR64_7436 [Paraburkholderia xenovorans LB400]|uniref:hypothetical protein n=1 Tax=Paraburkholderia xenovorans TaxID=36873 RepID=UPI0004F83132|nr:hypothetical protein [Paraburkholderia xenovorans]AIP35078.1 hypothetical protein DR64_7436 [Paraburkholderia xenovorans LB400]
MRDAPEQALCERQSAQRDELIHHSDKGVPMRADPLYGSPVRSWPWPSVGSTGDSCDNALAETINGLYKAGITTADKNQIN